MRSALIGLVTLSILPACSTVAGVGKDVSALGRGITHVSDEVREEVFVSRNQPRYVEMRYQSEGEPTVIVRQACDPYATQLRGGPDLPPCRTIDYRN
ncbi:hypothetical protein RYZ27_10215 [Hyphomonas sp. FCG-A18]|uniref:entericidin A/B family lipoprotein n=1 Tax=Hyphomonas sp. FCG-A18 TaxID=3080019 RepID=UPI002B2BB087|nr:hypothetical protein RYZ27_10215 [Hyphomonas sp. FCG-A18]